MTHPEHLRSGNYDAAKNAAALARLVRLLEEIDIDPRLDLDPEDREYTIAFPIKRPGMKVEKAAILSLEQSAMFCAEYVAAHEGDESLKTLLSGLLDLGSREVAEGREARARLIGQALFDSKFPRLED